MPFATFISSFPVPSTSLRRAQTQSSWSKWYNLRPAYRSVRVGGVAGVQRGRCGYKDSARQSVMMRDENLTGDTQNNNPSSWQFAYTLTTLASFLAGGRTLPILSGFFLGLARTVDAPLSLTAFSSVICSALIDILVLRVGPSSSIATLPMSLQEGVSPYAVFLIGCIATATVDFDGFFQTRSPGTKNAQDFNLAVGEENLDKPNGVQQIDELGSWDTKMGRRSVEKEK